MIERSVPGTTQIVEADLPLEAALTDRPVALAIITGVEGASYRPAGAGMVIDAAGHCTGNLSSGCLDHDVVHHAKAALASGETLRLRYGKGSPFRDITLPCGGGLDICVIPRPEHDVLGTVRDALAVRHPATLTITTEGRLSQDGSGAGLTLHIRPQIRFIVFGKGPEASFFARLAQQTGHAVELHSPDTETLEAAGFGHELVRRGWPDVPPPDPYTAVTLFFHDHDREPELLAAALDSAAFYVGAQGSLRAHLTRAEALRGRGVPEHQIERLASPFGLIPSVRDPRTLAVSVLAHVLKTAHTGPQYPRS